MGFKFVKFDYNYKYGSKKWVQIDQISTNWLRQLVLK